MAVVKYAEMQEVVKGKQPVKRYANAGIHFEDYWIDNVLWRYTWTNFTLDNPTHVEVNNMSENTDDEARNS